MIIVCSNCATRLQLDDAKVPSRPFTLRCPKCQNAINGQPPPSATDHSAVALGDSPATEVPRYEPPNPAPAFKPETNTGDLNAPSNARVHAADANELVRLLADLLQQRNSPEADKRRDAVKHGRGARRTLVCVTPAHREVVARTLAGSAYEVFVAENTTQAVESLREEGMDVVILDPEFDQAEQGAAFIAREVNVLRPAQRRRLFFVHLSPAVRTLDAHVAFLNNVNLVVNLADIANLPRTLERSIRDLNEMYSDFNTALKVAPL